MKKILAILAVVGIASGAWAGCGKKVTDTGELKKFDADSKVIVVDGAKDELTITPATKITDAEGKEIKVDDLVGKKVKVISEHKKVDSVTVAS